MKKFYLLALAFIFLIQCKTQKMSESRNMRKSKFAYPVTREDDVIEDYHGTKVADPFRWLEDDNSEETMAWVDAQNALTYGYLHSLPRREEFKNRLTKLWDYVKYGTPFKEGGRYYYFKNDGLQNQYVLYGANGPKEEGVVVLDPNKFSEDGTASLGGMAFNKSGDKLAYMVSEGGSDWRTIYVLDISTGNLMEDKVNWVKFSGISWQGDGFYYSRYPEPEKGDELSAANAFHALYYHQLGTPQTQDRLIFVDEDHPQRNVYASTTDDERFLIISTSESTSGNGLAFVDLEKNPDKIVSLVEGFDHDYSLIDNDGDFLLIMTNDGAPNNKVIKIDTKNPEKSGWKTIIKESEDPLKGISIVGGKMFATYMHNASSKIKVFDMDGKFIQDLRLPGIGSVGGVSGKKEDKTGFFTFTSFTRPATIYELDTESLGWKIFRKPSVDFDSDAYETVQEWYISKDGTKVPMFITKKKGLAMDGKRPTLLYGYGGFDISITPSFSLTKVPLLENDGIYVVANIRGGGEFGKKWHEAGTLDRKQNVFDDFIAAAQHLIDSGYTSPEYLAIEGGSNGGLLIGACMTQHPELFAVAFPRVGVLDMLRYHKFTIGWAWATDYGKSDDPEAFRYLIKYSPLHNVHDVDYPATLVMTADHDDRVVPAHSFKFAATLQKHHTGQDPVLIRIEKSAGHGAGKPTSKIIDEAADMLAFLFANIGKKN